MEVVLPILAIYYITLGLSNYDGPADIFIKLRERWLPPSLRKLFSCFICLSSLVSIPYAIILARDVPTFFLYWLSTAGAASFVFKLSEK